LERPPCETEKKKCFEACKISVRGKKKKKINERASTEARVVVSIRGRELSRGGEAGLIPSI